MISMLETILRQKNMSLYQCAKLSGIPYTTVSEIVRGKTTLSKCSAETVYKIARALGVSMEMLIRCGIRSSEKERMYESGLPDYLQQDLDAYKDGLKNGSAVLDCLWGELYGSIHIAEINEGSITPEHADYLRRKYLWGGTGV